MTGSTVISEKRQCVARTPAGRRVQIKDPATPGLLTGICARSDFTPLLTIKVTCRPFPELYRDDSTVARLLEMWAAAVAPI